jgi:hypothetical protein
VRPRTGGLDASLYTVNRGRSLRTTEMRMHHRHSVFAFHPARVDRGALGFVLLTLAASILWVGLYAGLTARAIGLL